MTRWKHRMLFGALAVLAPALAGCEAGFNAPTLEFHPAAFGAYASKNGVSISNAFVLGPPLNGPAVAGGRAGAFFAITARNGDKLVSVSAPGAASAVHIIGGSVRVPAAAPVTLTGPVPRVVLIGLANPLEGGDTGHAQPHLRRGGHDHGDRAGRAEGLRVRDVLPAAHPVASGDQEEGEGEPVGQRVRLGVGIARLHGEPHGHAHAVTGAPGPARSG